MAFTSGDTKMRKLVGPHLAGSWANKLGASGNRPCAAGSPKRIRFARGLPGRGDRGAFYHDDNHHKPQHQHAPVEFADEIPQRDHQQPRDAVVRPRGPITRCARTGKQASGSLISLVNVGCIWRTSRKRTNAQF